MADPRHILGQRGEDVTAQWLAANGWTLLARRWRCPAGELDLVLRDPAGTLVGVEVKVRSGTRAGSAAESLDPRRVARLRSALGQFLLHEGRVPHAGVRLDLVMVSRIAAGRWRLRRLPGIDAW